MISLVIFDLDETIVINEIPFSEMRERILRKIGSNENPPHLYEFLKEKNEDYLKILEEEEIRRAKHSRIEPHLPKILEELKKRGIRVAVLTRNSKRATMIALGKYAKYFDDIITREDEFEPKPSSDAIVHLLSKYRVKGEECLVVGDYLYDMQAGKSAGCITVCLGNWEADFKIKSLEEIIPLIDYLNNQNKFKQ